ncbi:phosphoglycolate phosphatase-like HAD superfamily hydrolase [Pseudochelatococcus lubricantis]|uniref:phosphoglycolate phosphatase n=1 Tax=Pseudochelatococcus lubricantis TaxID=1538102 RepID=A0ABX0V5R8_9HYPH|nr:HAD family hydrolase [Pseudochelatococcus lubricantis]NIJ60297.1 phosphoglycolate phosphatase-like HAD superfamily hydrolase [Pseudochelatococcus lubricantis]
MTNYRSIIFDCDGVILNSNRVKTEAFREAALPYGVDAAEALVAHHIAHGGVSRYRKFAHFLENIVSSDRPGPGLDALLERYAGAVRDGLTTCEIAEGLASLRASTPGVRWLVVSGGDQTELREIFAQRGIDRHFDGGIFGSPDNKDDILARESASGNIRRPALFLGDSRYDHEAATRAGLDFIFLNRWSEFAEWAAYSREHGFPVLGGLSEVESLFSIH